MNNPIYPLVDAHTHTLMRLRIKQEEIQMQIKIEKPRTVQSSLISALRSCTGNQPSQTAKSETLI